MGSCFGFKLPIHWLQNDKKQWSNNEERLCHINALFIHNYIDVAGQLFQCFQHNDYFLISETCPTMD